MAGFQVISLELETLELNDVSEFRVAVTFSSHFHGCGDMTIYLSSAASTTVIEPISGLMAYLVL